MKLFQSRHEAQKNWLERRTFLKAIGLGIAAPLALKMSKLATAQSAGKPTRLFIMYLPHGAPYEHYDPKMAGGVMDLAASGQGILSPLEPYKEWLTVLRGVGIQTADNHDAIRSVLTGKDGLDSIDYIIAKQLGLPAHVLGVQPYRANSNGPDNDSKLCYQGNWVTPIINPADAIEDLFPGLAIDSGGGAPPPDMTSMSAQADFRNEAIDLSIQDIEKMQSAVKGLTKEETKLATHLESLKALKESGAGVVVSAACKNGRPSLIADTLVGADPFDMKNFEPIMSGHLEAAANAIVCGTARIVTLQNMYANAQLMMDFPGGPGLTMNHHDPLSHSSDSAGRENFAKAQKWFYQNLADKFIKILAETDDPADPGKKVLDNTTILTCSEISDGFNHNSSAMEIWVGGKPQPSYQPWIILGKGGGLFGGNRIAEFTNLDHRNILAAVAESMGVSVPSIADLNVSTPAEVKA
jgi:hypothetical protein